MKPSLKHRLGWPLRAALLVDAVASVYLLIHEQPGLTWGNYLRIRTGMTRQEVESIFGERFPVEYVWRLAFRNDRLWVVVYLDGHERVERTDLILPQRTSLGRL